MTGKVFLPSGLTPYELVLFHLPVEHGRDGVMVRRKEIPSVCPVDHRIPHEEMAGDQDPVDGRHLLWPVEGMEGGLVLLARMDLPEGVNQPSIARQEAVGRGFFVGIEVAGYDERGLRTLLIEPLS